MGSCKGGNVTSAGWQVTLCYPVWCVSSRSGVATLRTAIHLSLTYLFTCRHIRYESRHNYYCCYTRLTESYRDNLTYLLTPRAELERTQLGVEWEPRDVDLAGAHEEAGRHPEAVTGRRYHHVGRVRAVDVLVGTDHTPVCRVTRSPVFYGRSHISAPVSR